MNLFNINSKYISKKEAESIISVPFVNIILMVFLYFIISIIRICILGFYIQHIIPIILSIIMFLSIGIFRIMCFDPDGFYNLWRRIFKKFFEYFIYFGGFYIIYFDGIHSLILLGVKFSFLVLIRSTGFILMGIIILLSIISLSKFVRRINKIELIVQ